MMLSAVLLSFAQVLSPAALGIVEESTEILIAGDDLAPDFPIRMQALPPDQRVLVIVHLRRAGLLGNAVMPVEWMTAPATAPAMTRRTAE